MLWDLIYMHDPKWLCNAEVSEKSGEAEEEK